jgi:hypothetical protein
MPGGADSFSQSSQRMKTKSRKLLIAVLLVLLLLGSGYWFVATRVDARGELQKMQLTMAEYLLNHDSRWPQPGDKDATTWWRTPGTKRMQGTFEVAQIEATPNMAFYRADRPWLTYTEGDGSRYRVLPDGTVKVTSAP